VALSPTVGGCNRGELSAVQWREKKKAFKAEGSNKVFAERRERQSAPERCNRRTSRSYKSPRVKRKELSTGTTKAACDAQAGLWLPEKRPPLFAARRR